METNDGGVVIRPAAVVDLDALLTLSVELDPANAATTRDAAARAFAVIAAAPDMHLLVAELDGRVAGTVMLAVLPSLTHGARNWAQLENMVVAGWARGRGVGRALVAACERIAGAAGCYKVQLQSANHRAGAHRFYEACGYEDRSRGYRKYLD